MSRELVWEGCVNVRDLGGLPAAGGGRIRDGALIRSDNIMRLTEEGWRAMQAHGVRTVIDLRWPEERRRDPPVRSGVDRVHVPLLGESSAWDAELGARVEGIEDLVERRTTSYLEALRTWSTRFADTVAAVAEAKPGGVLVHCVAGKDRTGLVVAILLSAVGVDAGAIADDYAHSEPALPELLRRWVNEAEDDAGRAWRAQQPIRSTFAAAMVAVLEELGDVNSYLRDAGLNEDLLSTLRNRLVEAA